MAADPIFRRITVDYDSGTFEMEVPDGTVFGPERIPSELPDDMGVRSATVDLYARRAELRLRDGSEATLELGSDENEAPLAGRAVVYLDYLHWVTLARQLRVPEKVPERDREAAARLVQMVEAGEIVLPVSSANLVEATRLGDRQRQDMAVTFIQLSRGWQMRNPLTVRNEELEALMRVQTPTAAEVFTLRPNAAYADAKQIADQAIDAIPGVSDITQRMPTVLATYAMALDPERLDSPEARALAQQWADGFSMLAAHLANEGAGQERTLRDTRAALVMDMASHVQAAGDRVGLSRDELLQWIEARRLGEGFAPAPSLGRIERIIYNRMRNPSDAWEENDLLDINSLTCAAGYADLVVTEKKMSGYLNRPSPPVTAGAYVCRTLAQALQWLDERAS